MYTGELTVRNSALDCVSDPYSITVTIEDDMDPTASNPAAVNVQCAADVPAADITVVTNEADNCTAAPVVVHVGDVSDGNTCPEVITRTYSVTDDCNNQILVTQTITILSLIHISWDCALWYVHRGIDCSQQRIGLCE